MDMNYYLNQMIINDICQKQVKREHDYGTEADKQKEVDPRLQKGAASRPPFGGCGSTFLLLCPCHVPQNGTTLWQMGRLLQIARNSSWLHRNEVVFVRFCEIFRVEPESGFRMAKLGKVQNSPRSGRAKRAIQLESQNI